jgi:hypothetical protein
MKLLSILVAFLLGILPLDALAGAQQDLLCAPLREFARSTQPGQTRTLEFHTVWGGDFKNVSSRSLFESQCLDHGYAPAAKVCKILMQQGAIEFSGLNATHALTCLSPGTRFASAMRIEQIDSSFNFGGPNHGSDITLSYGPASAMRGMVLVITAAGY